MVEAISEPGAKKIFVLDTNVFLFDPNALFVFKEHDVVIPIVVLEEIDRFKKDLNETGRNARLFSRHLDALREKGSLADGIALPDGGTVRVALHERQLELPAGFGPSSNDNLILGLVKQLHDDAESRRLADEPDARQAVLVTRDTNMRLKGDALGVRAEDYRHAKLDLDERYTGVLRREASVELVGALYESDRGFMEMPEDEPALEGVNPNQFLLLTDAERRSALARYEQERGGLRRIRQRSESVWGIRARNKEQLFALDLLLDERVQLVTLDGVAGTGKTLLAVACGLSLVADQQRYRRLLVARPIFPMGRDLGFLPGDINEKLNPWMKPIFDNLEMLLTSDASGSSSGAERRGGGPIYQPLIDQGILKVEPLTYIRGRSLPGQFVIVDEAQNLTPHEVKTILTRAGEGTKVVLTGDPHQIDNPYVDATSNGLTYVIERFKNSPLAGHVTLKRGERSELAKQAAERL